MQGKLLKPLLFIACATLGAGLFSPAATAATTTKKKDDQSSAPALPAQKNSILNKKSAVGGKKEKEGPAGFNTRQLSAQDRDAKADQKRDEEIEQLKKIIPKVQDGPQKADLLFQLSELWWEKSKFVYFEEMQTFDAEYEKYLAEEAKGVKGLSEPKISNRQSDLYRQQAINLYQQILQEYPTYQRKDEVLFNLAYNMYELGKKKDAVAHYWDLIRQYPDSKFVPDAYVQLGEHFFNSNDLERARKAYEKALEYNIPQIYAFALYKLAWCDYNAGNYNEALEKFRKVVTYQEEGMNAASKGDKKDKVQLKNEAMNDMILSFVALNQVDEAQKYYLQHASRKKAHRLMAKLGNTYFDAGKWDPSVRTYKIIIEDDPNDAENPSYQANIVKAYEGQRLRQNVREELKRLVDVYKPGTAWAQANSLNKVALANAYDLSESSMRELVTDYHAEAQKTKEVRTYRLARDIYKEYLENFPESENAYSLRFYYAEILYTLLEWEKAAEQYDLIVAKDPKGVYAKPSAFAALLCYEKLVAIAQGKMTQEVLRDDQTVQEKKNKGEITKEKEHLKTAGKDETEEAIPKWEKKLIQAADAYVTMFPGTTDEVDIRYKAAVLYYDHRQYVEAARRFGDVIEKFPNNKNAQIAADLIMAALETREKWLALNEFARKCAKNKQLNRPGTDFAKRLPGYIEGSAFKYAQTVYEAKDFEKAAVLFADFVKEFPKSQYAYKAVYNSMVMFENANKLDLAIPMGEKLLKDYGTSDVVRRTMAAVGQDYERIADFPKAAAMYEAYYNKYGKVEKPVKGKKAAEPAAATPAPAAATATASSSDLQLADALFNAALWNEGLGNFDKAVSLYDEYIKAFKDKTDVPEVAFTIALIYEKQKDWKAAVKAYDSYIKNYGKTLKPGKIFYARYRQMEALKKTGSPIDEKTAQKVGEELLKGYAKLAPEEQKEDGNLNAYGQLRFHELDGLWAKFKAIKIDNAAKLVQTYKAKLQSMPEVEKAYTEVAAIQAGDWTIAAVSRVGFGYLDFAKNITDSPDPKGLTPEQLDLYRAELENRALPLEDKGIEALEKALQKSSDLKVYNEWVLQAQDQENKFRPGAYGEIRSLPYQGSEFFVVAPMYAVLTLPAPPPAPTPAPTPAPSPTPAPAAPPAKAQQGTPAAAPTAAAAL
jgi:tetratricopeptide (TPR) repeat protein